MAQVPQITLKMLKGPKNKEFWPNRREEYQYGRKNRPSVFVIIYTVIIVYQFLSFSNWLFKRARAENFHLKTTLLLFETT